MTKEQYSVIKAGMDLERKYDIRQHEGMPMETCEIFQRYTEVFYLFPQDYSDFDREITQKSLLSCYSFWKEWFKSKDIAKKIQDKTNKCGSCYFYNTVKERVAN